jgi:ribosomal protein L37AE/L43A
MTVKSMKSKPKKQLTRYCPSCGNATVKDYYRELWICTNHKCNRCELVGRDF